MKLLLVINLFLILLDAQPIFVYVTGRKPNHVAVTLVREPPNSSVPGSPHLEALIPRSPSSQSQLRNPASGTPTMPDLVDVSPPPTPHRRPYPFLVQLTNSNQEERRNASKPLSMLPVLYQELGTAPILIPSEIPLPPPPSREPTTTQTPKRELLQAREAAMPMPLLSEPKFPTSNTQPPTLQTREEGENSRETLDALITRFTRTEQFHEAILNALRNTERNRDQPGEVTFPSIVPTSQEKLNPRDRYQTSDRRILELLGPVSRHLRLLPEVTLAPAPLIDNSYPGSNQYSNSRQGLISRTARLLKHENNDDNEKVGRDILTTESPRPRSIEKIQPRHNSQQNEDELFNSRNGPTQVRNDNQASNNILQVQYSALSSIPNSDRPQAPIPNIYQPSIPNSYSNQPYPSQTSIPNSHPNQPHSSQASIPNSYPNQRHSSQASIPNSYANQPHSSQASISNSYGNQLYPSEASMLNMRQPYPSQELMPNSMHESNETEPRIPYKLSFENGKIRIGASSAPEVVLGVPLPLPTLPELFFVGGSFPLGPHRTNRPSAQMFSSMREIPLPEPVIEKPAPLFAPSGPWSSAPRAVRTPIGLSSRVYPLFATRSKRDYPSRDSNAFCSFEGYCWERLERSAIINGMVIRRESNVTCSRCLELCAETWKLNNSVAEQRFCHSVTFASAKGVCDIFDVSGLYPLQQIIPASDRDYYRPTWNSGCGSPNCPEGKVWRGGSCILSKFEPRSSRVVETGILTGSDLQPMPIYGRTVFSEGYCRFDERCWNWHYQAALVRAVMFHRSTDISCNQCFDLCLSLSCRSLIYDHRWKFCDLYAVNGTNSQYGDYFLADYAGRDFFSPILSPECTAENRGFLHRDNIFSVPLGSRKSNCDVKGIEKLGGNFPKIVESCAEGWTDADGFCIKFFGSDTKKDFCGAHELCLAHNSHLPTNWSLPAMSRLKTVFRDLPAFRFHLGAVKRREAWEWVYSGEALDFGFQDGNKKRDGSCLDLLYSPFGNEITLASISCSEEAPVLCVRTKRVAECPSGDIARYILYRNMELLGHDDILYPAASLEDCIRACGTDSIGRGLCESFDYSREANGCRLAAFSHEITDLRVSPGVDFYEKLCFPSHSAAERNLVWRTEAQMFLLGFARRTSQAASLHHCLLLCLDSQHFYGFKCLSGMFYYETREENCILNTETAETRPNVFLPETEQKMIYFQIN